MWRVLFPFVSPCCVCECFRVFIVLLAFVAVLSMCLLYVSLGLMFMESEELFICSACCVLYYVFSGVKRVHVVLSGLRMRWFVCVHVCITCMYD